MKKKEYTADDVTVLEWRDAVRKRPAMYIGSTGFRGFLNILKSLFSSDFPMFEAEFHSFEIVDKLSAKMFFHKLKTPIPSNMNQILYLTSFEPAVLNALSQNYQFTLYDKTKNEILKQVYKQGILIDGIVDEKNYVGESLEILFELDTSIWKQFTINPHLIADLLKEIAFLNKNKTFELKYLDNNFPCNIIFHFDNGLQDLFKFEGMQTYQDNLYSTWIEKKFENFSAEIGFSFSNHLYNKQLFKSFVNSSQTPDGGTHEDAVISGITKALKKYVKQYCVGETFLLNGEIELSNNFLISKRIVRNFLIAVIRVKMSHPRFSSYYRPKLESEEVIRPLSDYIFQIFFQSLENDIIKANDLIKHFHAVHWKKSY